MASARTISFVGWQTIAALLSAASGVAFADEDPFSKQIVPFLEKHCYDCHQGDAAEAGVDLSQHNTLAEAQNARARWNQIRGLIELRAMPPEDHDPQPSEEQRQAIAKQIDQLVNRTDCGVDNDPGRVTMRRLNAVEYDNTLRDLLGVKFRASQLVGLPSDDVGNGFDNQGEVLSTSSLLLEKYLDAAAEVVRRTLEADAKRAPGKRRLLLAEPSDDLDDRQAARKIFAQLLPKAYRRPVNANEVERLVDLTAATAERGQDFTSSVGVGAQAMLISPHFLFRVESPATRVGQSPPEPTPVENYELASRLSYFLWASMPDDALLERAAAGSLNTDDELNQQIHRMLDAPGADQLVTRFFAQWLGLPAIEQVSPDPGKFPVWNTRLGMAMREETLRLCRVVMEEDRSLFELFDADYTFVNPRMAELYGMKFLGQDPRELFVEGPGPPEKKHRRGPRRGAKYRLEDRWIKVPLPPGRRGVMTHASVLTLTSNPAETSPVKRGLWVLDTVLGDPPPPAPPTVPSLEESVGEKTDLPTREKLAIHRENPSCASCHQQMDPIGLGLQNYDPLGRWRDTEHGHEVDASGELAGQKFEGPQQLLEQIRQREDAIARNFVRRLLTYALGRGLRPADECAVDEIVADAKQRHYVMSSLIEGVVLSEPFRMHGVRAKKSE